MRYTDTYQAKPVSFLDRRENKLLKDFEERFCLIVKEYNRKNRSYVYRQAIQIQKDINQVIKAEAMSRFGEELLNGIYQESGNLCNAMQLVSCNENEAPVEATETTTSSTGW